MCIPPCPPAPVAKGFSPPSIPFLPYLFLALSNFAYTKFYTRFHMVLSLHNKQMDNSDWYSPGNMVPAIDIVVLDEIPVNISALM